jgi:hypothetical protein
LVSIFPARDSGASSEISRATISEVDKRDMTSSPFRASSMHARPEEIGRHDRVNADGAPENDAREFDGLNLRESSGTPAGQRRGSP